MQLAKNSLWLLLARLGTQGMAALFTILLARRLGSTGFGEYAVIAAILFVGNMFTTFGTDMSLIREIAAREDLSLLPAALLLQLALSFLLISLIWIVAPFFPNQDADGVLALRVYSFALVPLGFFTISTTALRGRQMMDTYTVLNLIGSSIQLVLVWLFVNANIVKLSFLLLVTQIITAMIGAIVCHVRIPGFWNGWRYKAKDVFDLIRITSPFALLTVFAVIYQRLSVLLVSGISGPAVTGLFSAAQRTLEAAKTGHSAVFTALYPAMAQDREKSFRISWILLLLGAGLGAVTLSALAMPLTRLLFGGDYEASASVLRILAWILVPYSITTFLTLKLIALDQERPVIYASLTGLLVLLTSSLWWIPHAALTGAASSMLVAESLQAVLLLLQSRQHEFSKLPREAQI